jgi:hypothetical protein
VTAKKEGESEFLPNRPFMLISGLLVAVSLAAFLWLAGVFEWRGSGGDSRIDVTLQCGNPAPKGTWAITFLDCEDSTIEVDLGSDTDPQSTPTNPTADKVLHCLFAATSRTEAQPFRLKIN